jgi:hypothetical protein
MKCRVSVEVVEDKLNPGRAWFLCKSGVFASIDLDCIVFVCFRHCLHSVQFQSIFLSSFPVFRPPVQTPLSNHPAPGLQAMIEIFSADHSLIFLRPQYSHFEMHGVVITTHPAIPKIYLQTYKAVSISLIPPQLRLQNVHAQQALYPCPLRILHR